MARFYAEIRGTRGVASRNGNTTSGIWGHIRGWDVGVEVRCFVDDEKNDVCEVYKTGGSNGRKPSELLYVIKESQVEQAKL